MTLEEVAYSGSSSNVNAEIDGNRDSPSSFSPSFVVTSIIIDLAAFRRPILLGKYYY